LVQRAYKPAFDAGADGWSPAELVDFFRVNSSASQAKNAARFFRAVCSLADHDMSSAPGTQAIAGKRVLRPEASTHPTQGPPPTETLPAKSALLEKLPAVQPGWSAEEYLQICDRFIEMLRHLDAQA
jgi:hypothetical protein